MGAIFAVLRVKRVRTPALNSQKVSPLVHLLYKIAMQKTLQNFWPWSLVRNADSFEVYWCQRRKTVRRW
jgi:hypothetical protein